MNKPWFVPRKYGYGLTPVTWQGWVCTVACVAGLYAVILFEL